MKRILIILAYFFLWIEFLNAQNINPSWQFVGPRSTNQAANNPFRSGQIDDVAVDPANSSHIIASSFNGGLWESYDYVGGSTPSATWLLFPNFDNPVPIGMGDNQVNAVEFRNSNELYAANANSVFVYDYTATTWTQLGAIPNPGPTWINQIVFFPNDPNHVFLCTTTGLVESTNAGATWFQSPTGSPITDNILSIVFVEKTTAGTYFWYVAGQNTSGTVLLMESTDDGATFSDVTQYTTLSSITAWINSADGICLGDQTAVSGDRDIFISTAVSNNDWGCTGGCFNSNRFLHKLTKNINSGNITVSNSLISTGAEYANSPVRLIIGYDQTNNRVITGGVHPHAFNLTTNTASGITSIHDDYHALYINSSSGQILLGCDGGFASVSFSSGNYTSHRLNYGLDICLINGFSGATESNLYVYGQQDETISDLYDETVGRVIATKSAGENDGGLIDKFNGNKLIITDYSSYDSYYKVADDGANNFSSTTSNYFHYAPSNTPSYYFEPDLSQPNTVVGQGFGRHPFFQIPFREGRIFCTGGGGSIYQFDPVSKKFVWKVRLDDGIQHFTCSPTLQSIDNCSFSPCNCTVQTTSSFLILHTVGWQSQPVSASFSQLDPNIMYVITANNWGPCCLTAAQVVQYIGNNLDDMWTSHYEVADNSGNPQWQVITPDFESAPFYMSASDIYHIQFTAIETSNWDKNKIYVSCQSDLPSTTFPYKVLTYDRTTGVWSDYSNGIPADDNVANMVMDHASNDGIYVNTQKGMYYREPGMLAWVNYNNGPPGTVMPYLRCTQMEINYRENTVRAGTYGRGIWKSNLVCPSIPSLTIPTGTINNYFEADDINTTFGSPNSTVTDAVGSTVFRATNAIKMEPGFTADASPGTNYFIAFIHGCVGGSSTSSYNYFRSTFDYSQTDFDDEDDIRIAIYPNPTNGTFTVQIDTDVNSLKEITVSSLLGSTIFKSETQSPITKIDLSSSPNGIYFVKVIEGNRMAVKKIVKM